MALTTNRFQTTANNKSKRRQSSSIRPNGAGFEVRGYAGRDPLTKKDIYLHAQADTEVEAEKARTKLLHQVDENRHPKTQVTMSFLLDRWLGVAELDETSYERTEGIIRNYLKPTFGGLKAAKLNAEMLELVYARLPWEVIAKDLADAIKDGTMLPGEDVPTVGDIAQAHGASVGTAHRAVAQLENDGLIEVSRGRRGIVRPRQRRTAVSRGGRLLVTAAHPARTTLVPGFPRTPHGHRWMSPGGCL